MAQLALAEKGELCNWCGDRYFTRPKCIVGQRGALAMRNSRISCAVMLVVVCSPSEQGPQVVPAESAKEQTAAAPKKYTRER